MRDYGKVHTSFWTSSNIHSLSDDGRMLALYLLTCPHGTISGVFRLPDGYACEDLQWTAEKVKTTLAELFNNGFATRCEVTKWVWVIKHFEWNPPENPNQRKAAAKMADQIPSSCSWKVDFIDKCGSFLDVNTKKPEPLLNPLVTVPQPVSVTGAVTGAGMVPGNPSGSVEPPPPFDDQLPENQIQETTKTSNVTMPGAVCIALKSLGMSQVNPSNLRLKNLLDAGADIGMFVEAGRECVANQKPFPYLLATVEGRLAESERQACAAIAKTQPTNGILPGAI